MIGTAPINNSNCEKLLRIKIDCKLGFDDHVGNICKKGRLKIKWFAQYTNTEKGAELWKHFFVTI